MSSERSDRDLEFQRLFERFYRPVARFFVNRGFDLEDSRDMAQETFASIYNGLDGFRQESSEETWLFKIAANTWRNALRKRAAVKRDADETSLDELLVVGWDPGDADSLDARDPLAASLGEERSRMLRKAIDELPAEMRRCVLLRVAQDMKYREIAAIMQISIQTVKSQLYQARERLRTSLGDYFDELDRGS